MTAPVERYWAETADALLARLSSRADGLTSAEAMTRSTGKARAAGHGPIVLFLRQLTTPITIVLLVAAGLSFALGDRLDAVIIVTLVLAGAVVAFVQEATAATAVKRLQETIRVTTRVLRDGKSVDLPVADVVPGDVVSLAPGDLVPADGVVLDAHDVLVDEAAITGESFPVEKQQGTSAAEAPLGKRGNAVSLGTHVVSGNCRMLAVQTGAATTYGDIARRVGKRAAETDFERGVRRFGGFLLEVTLLLVLAIFAVNVGLHRPVLESLLFAVALAVGLTPQLLPAVVAVNLAHGARRMAQRRVIVKRLPAIENLGSMTVLCTDKTGTLTEGTVEVRGAEDLTGVASERVRLLAAVNARFASSGQSPIDAAIRAAGAGLGDDWQKLDEAPYDFHRKRLSVLARHGDVTTMITKGALANVLAVCTQAERADGTVGPLDDVRAAIVARATALGAEGQRVLGVATRSDVGSAVRREDEQAMVLVGLVVLFDPPKKGARATIDELRKLGVRTVVVTGDSGIVAAAIAKEIGLDSGDVVTGAELDAMTPEALQRRARSIVVAAEVEPRHKERIVQALRAAGEVTGFLGDGINDAPALHAADVGVSVESACDIAKDAAAIVLLEKDLAVLAAGIHEGRATFANTLKYVFMATSANFGNMFSMAGASLFLPFLPLLPKQILLMNLLTDLPEMTIATDRVDAELVERPRRWDVHVIRRFMLVFGLLSSVFDFATFGALLWVHATPDVLRTGWMVESVVSATMIVLVIRTRRPLVRSLPGRALSLATLAVIAITVALPYTPLAAPLGLAPLTLPILGMLAAIVAVYVLSAEIAKRFFYARHANS